MKKIDVILTTYNSSKFIVDQLIHQKGNGEVFNINLIVWMIALKTQQQIFY